jgi:hypothetical protein
MLSGLCATSHAPNQPSSWAIRTAHFMLADRGEIHLYDCLYGTIVFMAFRLCRHELVPQNINARTHNEALYLTQTRMQVMG